MGGMRVDLCEKHSMAVFITIDSFVYRLRSAESLLADDTLLLAAGDREYLRKLITDLRSAAEDASSFVFSQVIAPDPAPEAGVGSCSDSSHPTDR